MSGTFPTTPGVASFDVTSNQKSIVSISDSGKRQSRIVGGHLWEINITFSPMLQSMFAPIDAFIMSQRGESESFDLTSPIGNQGTFTSGSVVLNSPYGVGATSIGLNATALSTAKAGDIIRFANHTKVYKIIIDATFDAFGYANITIEPPLIEAVIATESVTVVDVKYRVYKKGIHKVPVSAPRLYKYSADFIEAIE